MKGSLTSTANNLPPLYIYTYGYVLMLTSTGLVVNSYELTKDQQPFKEYTNLITGDMGLSQGSKYLNIDSNGKVSLTDSFQAIKFNKSNGSVVAIIGGQPKFVNVSVDLTVTLDNQQATTWVFSTVPNYSLFSPTVANIYNDTEAPYFPMEYAKVKDWFQTKQSCPSDGNCFYVNDQGQQLCQATQKKSMYSHLDCNQSQCASDMNFVYCDGGGAFHDDHLYCARPGAETNLEKCSMGSADVLVDGKLNPCACKLTSDRLDISGYCFNNDGNGCKKSSMTLANKAYGPWSLDVQGSEGIIEFCSQHDTESDGPYLFKDKRCLNWASDDHNRYLQTLDQYCAVHPETSFCADFCASQPNTTSTCFATMKAHCQGDQYSNLGLPECRQWCKNVNVDCDADLQTYCQSDTPQKMLQTDPELCGCFLKPSFYDNYFKTLNSKIKSPSDFTPLKQCFFGPCASSKLQPKLVKQGKGLCPSIQTCIEQVNFDNSGVITGDVTISQNNLCAFNPVVTYGWKVGDWGDCSDNGQQTRTVVCMGSDGQVSKDESVCVQAKPTSYQSCTPPPKPIVNTYSYKTGEWSDCKDSKETRTVVCVDQNGNEVPEGFCKGLNKPTDTQTCEMPPTPPTPIPDNPPQPVQDVFNWSKGDWSVCSPTGQQTRSVVCKDITTGTIVEDTKCTENKPPVAQTCASVNKNYLYASIILGFVAIGAFASKKASVLLSVVLALLSLVFAYLYMGQSKP